MKKLLKQARAFVLDNWQVGLLITLGIAATIGLLFIQLGSLVHGLSEQEFILQQQLANDSMTLQSVLEEPLFLPYKLALLLFQYLPFSGPTTLRSIGAIFGLMGALGFYYVLRKWYSLRIAVFGTALFVSASWFLHTARYASPEVSYLLLPLLIAAFVGLQRKARSELTVLLVLIFGFMAFYIPGVVWFLVPAVILQRRTIARSLGMQSTWFNVVVGLVSLVMLVPFATMIALNTADTVALHNLLGLLGLPTYLPSVMDVLRNIVHGLGDIFVYNTAGPLYVPGHLPWLDAASVSLVLAGCIQFWRHRKLDRSKLIAIAGVSGLLLSSIGGPVSLVILLPFVYLLAVEGLRWLLDIWLSIFPRNPFARGFGVGVVVCMLLAIGFYQTSKYYLAWGQAPETQAVFNKLP